MDKPLPKEAGGPRENTTGTDESSNGLEGNAVVHKGEHRVQVAFRMEKSDYVNLKRLALDEDTTINELLIRAIKHFRKRKETPD